MLRKALNGVVIDTTEQTLSEVFGVGRVTATIQEETEPQERWRLDCTFTGELDDDGLTYVSQNETGYMALTVENSKYGQADVILVQKEGERLLESDGTGVVDESI